MGWNRSYTIGSYLRSALWIVPLFAVVVEQIGIRFTSIIDNSLQWAPRFSITAAEAGDKTDTCPWNADNYGVRNTPAGQAYYDSIAKLYAGWGVDLVKT